jgi:hypothetical protein
MSASDSCARASSADDATRRSARRSTRSCGRVTSSRERTFSAIRCPVRATPIVRFGSSSIRSASATTSGSIPDEANSRSITGAWSLLERESHRRDPADSLLLHNRFDAVVAGPQTVNESFGLRIARQRNCEVGIPGKPGCGTRGNGEAANQCERDVGFSEVCVDLAQGRFERCHVKLVPMSTRRPGQSPASAPGRSRSQPRSSRSISSTPASG